MRYVRIRGTAGSLPQEISSLLTDYKVLKQLYDQTQKQEQTKEQFEKLENLFKRINRLLGNNNTSQRSIKRIEDPEMKSVTRRTAELNLSKKPEDQ